MSDPSDMAVILELITPESISRRYTYNDGTQRDIHQLLMDGGKPVANKSSVRSNLSAITMLELNDMILAHGGDLWSAK